MNTPQPQYRAIFPVYQPILVRPPLSPNEQEILQQHGCIVASYPESANRLPDILKGHMVTFPEGTQLGEKPFTNPAHMEYGVLFPDGYKPTLVWSGNYSMCNVVSGEVSHG